MSDEFFNYKKTKKVAQVMMQCILFLDNIVVFVSNCCIPFQCIQEENGPYQISRQSILLCCSWNRRCLRIMPLQVNWEQPWQASIVLERVMLLKGLKTIITNRVNLMQGRLKLIFLHHLCK